MTATEEMYQLFSTGLGKRIGKILGGKVFVESYPKDEKIITFWSKGGVQVSVTSKNVHKIAVTGMGLDKLEAKIINDLKKRREIK